MDHDKNTEHYFADVQHNPHQILPILWYNSVKHTNLKSVQLRMKSVKNTAGGNMQRRDSAESLEFGFIYCMLSWLQDKSIYFQRLSVELITNSIPG